MKLKVGEPIVIPRFDGVSSVTAIYVGLDVDMSDAVDLVNLNTAEGPKSGYPANVVRKQGRPLMSVGEARQVLSILANRFAPVSELQPKARIIHAQKALARRDPIEMAKVLRELLVRAQGRAGAPIRISFDEVSMRNRLTGSLCAELTYVLQTDSDFKEKIGMGADCEASIQKISQRVNPAPSTAAVGRYRAVYTSFPSTGIASELRTIARTVKKKATSDDPEHRADLNARQHALLSVIDARSRRSDR